MRLPETPQTPKLTDRRALDRNRARAAALATPAWFLHEHTCDMAQERLQDVNRTFTNIAAVTPVPPVATGFFAGARLTADEDKLDLSLDTHDLVLHLLGLHWANDPVGQLVQCRRALKPDGLFLGATFGGQTLFELRAALAEAESRVTGGLSPRVAPMGEIRDYGGLLQRAGFAMPVADSTKLTVEYDTALHLMRDLRAMGEANAMTARPRKFSRRDVFSEAAKVYAEAYQAPSGRIIASFEIVFLTGWAPADNQPKPLRPGSAKARLADALGVPERPSGEKPGSSGV